MPVMLGNVRIPGKCLLVSAPSSC